MDRQNYDTQDSASIAASHGKIHCYELCGNSTWMVKVLCAFPLYCGRLCYLRVSQ